jgi:L-lactate transport
MNPVWSQTYEPISHALFWSSVVAAIPIITLLLLLGVLRKPAWMAGLAGLGVTGIIAIGPYHMPPVLAVSSAAYGAAFGLFPISWIVFWAIFLYRLTVKTGKFEVIKSSIGAFTSDPRLQALLIAFAFGAFIEGAAGFGTPVAVAAAMLMGFGFSPFYSSAICLLANTAPVAFGSIGIPVITLAGITGLPLDRLSADVGKLCAPLSLLVPAYLILTMSGVAGLTEVWPAVLVCGGLFASVQFFVSNYIGPQLTDILSSLTAMIGLLLLLRVWRPKTEGVFAEHFSSDSGERAKPNRTGGGTPTTSQTQTATAVREQPVHLSLTTGQIVAGWMPYIILVVCVLLWGYKPFQTVLNSVTHVFPWPMLHNDVLRTPPVVSTTSPYAALYTLNWLSASGTSCMVATILSAIFLRISIGEFFTMLVSVTKQLLLPTLTVSSVLAMAFLMNYCGATGTLGLAFSATGVLFPFFSALLGWLGVFLTGSDTSANALFGNLQVVTAHHLGLSPSLIAASNSAGGVMGKMISLQTIAVAAAATSMSVHDQARLFRFTLRHSVILATAVGLEVLFYAYLAH